MGRRRDQIAKNDDLKYAVRLGDLLVALMDAPAGLLNNWEQGFVAALTWTEKEVLDKVEDLAARNLPRSLGLS